MPIKLVVGLGNPGRSYAGTRHNVGYRVLDALEAEPEAGVHLFRSPSFMNESGGPVSEQVRRKGLEPQQVLVVCDDFALPLGQLRLRLKGSSGGHNGLESILERLGSQEVPRLRVGIGPVPEGADPKDFVLGPFRASERALLDETIARAVEAVRVSVREGFETAMNRFNKKAES